MKINKPGWVKHCDENNTRGSIYSVDIQPNGDRLASAGGDGNVKLWTLSSITNEEAEKDKNKAKLLCTLAYHQGSVNCVRWSHNGRFLASAADDGYVMVYERKSGPPAAHAFGSGLAPNVENWARVCALKGHNMDVPDLSWSPDDRLIVSSSIDNTICVWRTDKLLKSPVGAGSVMQTLHPHKILTGHSSWVKGVTWDPIGKYMASAGEDKTVIIWRVEDWKEEAKITKPFTKAVASSHFRRLSWSPDGSYLCATHAFKSKQNIAALLARGTWEVDVDLVGHEAPVTAARFNSRLFERVSSDRERKRRKKMESTSKESNTGAGAEETPENDKETGGEGAESSTSVNGLKKAKTNKEEGDSDHRAESDEGSDEDSEDAARVDGAVTNSRTCCAVGSKDAAITVWSSGMSRPIAVVRNCFETCVVDFAWSSDGHILVACSLDGSICAFQFDKTEIGRALSERDHQRVLKSKYGTTAGTTVASVLVETPMQLDFENDSQQTNASLPIESQVSRAIPTPGLSSPARVTVQGPKGSPLTNLTRERQIVVNKGGKKRITPVLVSGNGTLVSQTSQPMATPASASPPLLQSSPMKRQRVYEASHPLSRYSPMKTVNTYVAPAPFRGPAVSSGAEVPTGAGLPAKRSPSLPVIDNGEHHCTYLRAAPGTDWRESSAVPGSTTPEERTEDTPLPPLLLEYRVIKPGETSSAASAISTLASSTPPSTTQSDKRGGPVSAALASLHRPVTQLSLSQGGKVIWEESFAGQARCMAGNEQFSAVATLPDAALHLYSRAGRRLCPPLIMSSALSFLEVSQGKSPYLLAISSDCSMRLWTVGEKNESRGGEHLPKTTAAAQIPPSGCVRSVLSTSIAPILQSAYGTCCSEDQFENQAAGGGLAQECSNASVQVVKTAVTPTGLPILTLAVRGAHQPMRQFVSFCFDAAADSWVRIADDSFALSSFHSFSPPPMAHSSSPSPAPYSLAGIQALSSLSLSRTGSVQSRSPLTATLLLGEESEVEKNRFTRSHLECQIAAARLLQSTDEHRTWLKMYVRHLSETGDVRRLRELCDELLGPIYEPSKPAEKLGSSVKTGWDPLLLDTPKRQILMQEVLTTMGRNRSLQRMVQEYVINLEEIARREKEKILSGSVETVV